jgi:hypothetical protein
MEADITVTGEAADGLAALDTRVRTEASELGVDRCVSKSDMSGVVAAVRELAAR